MGREEPSRLLRQLPAIYREDGSDGDLARLLRPLEELFFWGSGEPSERLPAVEAALGLLPAVFAPLGSTDGNTQPSRTLDRFLPWLATWLAFVPHALVEPERLRHVVAGIVPLYGRRGTRAYLERLIRLCFDEIEDVKVDEHENACLRVGSSRIGVDSLLAEDRPFWFRVDVDLRATPAGPSRPAASARFERRLRAIIDFAKPAHTAYNLRVHARADAVAAGPRGQASTVE